MREVFDRLAQDVLPLDPHFGVVVGSKEQQIVVNHSVTFSKIFV